MFWTKPDPDLLDLERRNREAPIARDKAAQAKLRADGEPARVAYRASALAFFNATKAHWPALYQSRVQLMNEIASVEGGTVRGAVLRPDELEDLCKRLVPLAEKAATAFLEILPRAPLSVWVDHGYATRVSLFERGSLDEHLEQIGDAALDPLRTIAKQWGFNVARTVPPTFIVLHPAIWLFAVTRDPNAGRRSQLAFLGYPPAEIVKECGVAPGPDPLDQAYRALLEAASRIHQVDVVDSSNRVKGRLNLTHDPTSYGALVGPPSLTYLNGSGRHR
jgi:hypothetical protein